MPRSNKPHNPQQPKTGNQYIEHARRNGAVITQSRGGFKKIETPDGATYVAPGNQPLDPRTRKNLNHWFKLLGLMIIILFCTLPFWGPYIGSLLFGSV